MCFKSSVRSARFGVSDWLEEFEPGHRTLEWGNAIVNAVQAIMVLTIVNGKSVAPFLESALFRLDSQTTVPIWVVLLLAAGCFQMLALAICAHRKTYLLRLWACIFSAFLALAILLALRSGPQPWIIVVRYSVPFFVQTFAVAVLMAKHRSALAEDE
ncbi:hypothetical protein IAD21_00907 [Abditibacteriota bacterium]|nr:hypothetical protein IAD21_00907 [Abditibacteriota bacterium]